MWAGLSGGEEGLIGYWKLDEGEGSVAVDSSPNHKDGTLVGNATWCTFSAPVPSVSVSWGRIKAGRLRGPGPSGEGGH